MELPIVRMAPGARSLELLGRTPQEFIHRALATEDCNDKGTGGGGGGGGPLATAIGTEYASRIYEPGAVSRSGLPSLHAYLARRAGMFPDVCEALAHAHVAKGDMLSALITAEWYFRQGNFPDWGRPYEFAVFLLQQAGREEEMRDMARIALRTPWWTLSGGVEPMLEAAGMQCRGADAVRAALEEQDEMANGGALQGKFRTNPKSDKQKIMDEVVHWLNKGAVGEMGWDEVRPRVVEELERAGLVDSAEFVRM